MVTAPQPSLQTSRQQCFKLVAYFSHKIFIACSYCANFNFPMRNRINSVLQALPEFGAALWNRIK